MEYDVAFRVHTRITALSFESDTRDAVLIPRDALLNLIMCPHEGDARMAQVSWDGQPLLVFQIDLIERARPVRRPHNQAAEA